MDCVFVRLSCFFAVVLLCLVSEVSSQGQKKGFRGGDKSYGIKVEATAIGTNLQYKLPEAKAKSSSPTDWQVDNDNADMVFAMNSPILATVITTNPKFSVKGQWPGYKTTLTLPKGVKTGSKKNELGARLDGGGSGLENDDEENFSGSGNIKDDNVKDSSGSGFSIYEELENQDLEETNNASPGSVSTGGGKYESRNDEPQENQLPKAESKQQHERRSNVSKTPPKQNSSEEFQDLSLEKVQIAVESLKHFNFKDPRTSKALKDIIAHAKKVVKEAKMVLSDVASVVTSVRDFVNGNLYFDERIKTNDTLLEGKNDSVGRIKKGRQESEKAALQASHAARRAQAASKMARKFANDIWNSAKTSGSLSKSSNAIFTKQKSNDGSRKSSFSEKQNKKEMPDVLKNVGKILGIKYIKAENHWHRNVTQVQHHYRTSLYHQGNQRIANINPLGFMVAMERGNHRNHSVMTDNKKSITKKGKKEKKSKYTKKDSSRTKLIKDENFKTRKASFKQSFEIEQRKEADKTHSDNREALKAATLQNTLGHLLKKTNLHKEVPVNTRVLSLVGLINSTTPKVLLPWQHRLPGDANEVGKNTEARPRLKADSNTGKMNGEKKRKQRKGNKEIVTGSGGSDGIDDDNDVNSDLDQPGSTISGSYDIEMEPENIEFVKGEGKMDEKRIRIKDLTAKGQRNKVPPATLKEILKAIKRVEGILGFTIEKTKTNGEKTHL